MKNSKPDFPLISILMPVYNEEKYIKYALDSVLLQKGDFYLETIVVDDFSTDTTTDTVSHYRASHPEIRLFQNDKKGKNEAFNKAYHNSQREYYCFLAGDDMLPINAINIRINPLLGLDLLTPMISHCLLETISEREAFNGIQSGRNAGTNKLSGECII